MNLKCDHEQRDEMRNLIHVANVSRFCPDYSQIVELETFQSERGSHFDFWSGLLLAETRECYIRPEIFSHIQYFCGSFSCQNSSRIFPSSLLPILVRSGYRNGLVLVS